MELGRGYLRDHELRRLRERYGFSRSAQAHMIGVSPTALKVWEDGGNLSRASAERVVKWYELAQESGVADNLLKQIQDGNLIHVTVASQQLAMSYGTILEKCRSGVLTCVDLGAFGLYINRAELLAAT
jgi:DNA-binding XRE family transcriptional regulator